MAEISATFSRVNTDKDNASLFGTGVEDEEINRDWSIWRQKLAEFFKSMKVEAGLACIVLFNVVFVIAETDYVATDSPVPGWIDGGNVIFLIIYTCDLICRLAVYRLAFFGRLSSVADLAIVSVDLGFLFLSAFIGDDNMPSVSIFRIFRLARLGRTVKVLIMFPELNRMINSLIAAMNKIFWGSLLMSLTIVIWAILAVQILHPINKDITADGYWEGVGCERCPRAFESVWNAALTFVQHLIAGDSWGTVSLPIIERSPISLVFFAAMMVSVSLVVMNLILAMIVDSSHEAREQEDVAMAKIKDQEFESAKGRLLRLCEVMDIDASGNLTLDEITHGYESNAEFKNLLRVMDVQKEDLSVVFSILDADGSGDIDYNEFVEQLHKMKRDDAHTLLIFIKYYVTEVHSRLGEQLRIINKDLLQKFNHLEVVCEGAINVGHVTSMHSEQSFHSQTNRPIPDEATLSSQDIRKVFSINGSDDIEGIQRHIDQKFDDQRKILTTLHNTLLKVPSRSDMRSGDLCAAPISSSQKLHPTLKSQLSIESDMLKSANDATAEADHRQAAAFKAVGLDDEPPRTSNDLEWACRPSCKEELLHKVLISSATLPAVQLGTTPGQCR